MNSVSDWCYFFCGGLLFFIIVSCLFVVFGFVVLVVDRAEFSVVLYHLLVVELVHKVVFLLSCFFWVCCVCVCVLCVF